MALHYRDSTVTLLLQASDMCILFELCPGSLYEYLHKLDDPMPETPLLVKLFREVWPNGAVLSSHIL